MHSQAMASLRSASKLLHFGSLVLLSCMLIATTFKAAHISSRSPQHVALLYGAYKPRDEADHAVVQQQRRGNGHKNRTADYDRDFAAYHDRDSGANFELEKRIDLFSSRASRKLRKKGRRFQCWLDGAPGVPATKFAEYTDLAKWGWTLDRQNHKDYEHVAKWLNTAPGVDAGDMTHGMGMSWKHSQESKDGGKTYPVS